MASCNWGHCPKSPSVSSACNAVSPLAPVTLETRKFVVGEGGGCYPLHGIMSSNIPDPYPLDVRNPSPPLLVGVMTTVSPGKCPPGSKISLSWSKEPQLTFVIHCQGTEDVSSDSLDFRFLSSECPESNDTEKMTPCEPVPHKTFGATAKQTKTITNGRFAEDWSRGTASACPCPFQHMTDGWVQGKETKA